MATRLAAAARWAGAASAAVALAVGATWLVPRLVRDRATQEAAKRGLALSARVAKLGWFSVTLEDIDVEPVDVHDVKTHFAAIRVDVDSHLHPVSVAASGGTATARDNGSLMTELEAWRARRASPGGSAGGRPVVADVQLDTLSVTLGERHLSGTNVRVHHEGDKLDISLGAMEAASGLVGLNGMDARVVLSGSPLAFHDAALGTGSIVWVLAVKTELPDPASADLKDLRPPVDPPVLTRPKKGAPPPSKEAAATIPPLLPDLHALRATLGGVIAAAALRIPDGSTAHVDALSVRVQRGDEELTLGSGRFDINRDPQRIELKFSTSPLAHATPLSLRADLPTGAGDIEVSASGGPVPLGLLGMHDGGLLHLLDVDHTSFAGQGRVVLDDRGHALTFDVEGAVRALSMRDPRLAHDPVRGMDLGVRARGLIEDRGELRLDDAEATIGAARATLHGGMVQTPDHLAAAFDFDFPTSSCQALLTSVPSALLPTVGAARMDGTFSLRGRLAFDTRNLDAISFDYDVSDRCRLVDVPSDLDKARFSRSFSHVVYSKSGQLAEETTGPGTPSWTELDEISPYMQVAVLTTEDGAFFHHHGFNHTAIRRALAANIKAHRFVRGASTITMQLAKNLFLSREKTVARKLEELVLADYLEQAFTKDEMMELYLNIIEFGPDVYGVTAAAEHYFARKPGELNLAESMFLSSILPNPIAFHRVYEKGAQLGDGWMRTLRARMDVAAHNGLISPVELAEGLTETVVFHHEGDPPPPPRQPVTTPAHRENGAEWQELN